MNLQDVFKSLLLRNIEIEKLGIKGKLQNVLFTTENNGFSIELTIAIDDRQKTIKIPAPFNIETHTDDSLIFLDYRLNTVFCHDRWKPIVGEIKNKYLELGNFNKFFDCIIEISYC